MNKKDELIPSQKTGASSDTTATHVCANEKEAQAFFEIVKRRLLHVNEWELIAGIASADFQLCDENGFKVNRAVQLHDYIRIDIPGPGPVTGDGYDWVQVQNIDEENSTGHQLTGITVRPVGNPNNENKDVAHFFSDDATSSFIVERKGNLVTASVHGRNEKPNDNADKMIDKARNAATAAAAISAFSKLQWKSLVDGLLKE